MTAKAEDVAATLSRLYGNRPLDRHVTEFSHGNMPGNLQVRLVDQVAELGRQLADSLAAAGLEIGGYLQTDQGAFFAAVLEQVSPPILATDERLVVDILTEAARLQTKGKQQQARPVAILGAVLLLGLALLTLTYRPSAAPA